MKIKAVCQYNHFSDFLKNLPVCMIESYKINHEECVQYWWAFILHNIGIDYTWL